MDWLPNLTVHQLRYVREAATARTFAVAAANLGVSQPALTQGIAEVERRLGAALFDRSRRLRTPTPVLADVLHVANQVLAAVDDLSRRLDERQTGHRGEIRVGMIDTAALGLFAEPVATFRTEHPLVTTTLMVEGSVALTQRVADGSLDLALVVGPNAALDPQLLLADALLTEELAIYLPADMPRTSEEWNPWVTYPASSQTRVLIDAALADRGIVPRVVAESSNPDVLRQMVRLGVGCCVLPRSVAETGDLALYPAEATPLATRTIALIRRRTALPNPAADSLANAFIAVVA